MKSIFFHILFLLFAFSIPVNAQTELEKAITELYHKQCYVPSHKQATIEGLAQALVEYDSTLLVLNKDKKKEQAINLATQYFASNFVKDYTSLTYRYYFGNVSATAVRSYVAQMHDFEKYTNALDLLFSNYNKELGDFQNYLFYSLKEKGRIEPIKNNTSLSYTNFARDAVASIVTGLVNQIKSVDPKVIKDFMEKEGISNTKVDEFYNIYIEGLENNVENYCVNLLFKYIPEEETVQDLILAKTTGISKATRELQNDYERVRSALFERFLEWCKQQ